jgi:hypothetical protein
MNEPMDDRKLVEQAKKLFDESVDDIDAASLSRLNRGRHEALAELDRGRSFGRWMRWAPAAGMAAAAVLAVIMLQGPVPTDVDIAPATVTDFEIIMDESDIEMFEELEFYALMDALENNGNVG